MWHARARGRPSYNLDFNTQSRDEIAAMFATKSVGSAISIIEANKGLYDGVDLEGSDSNATRKISRKRLLAIIKRLRPLIGSPRP